MKRLTALFLLLAVLDSPPLFAQNIDVRYGTVTKVETSKANQDSSRQRTGAATGGLVGGLLGATSTGSSGDKRRRSLFYGTAGAIVGGAVGNASQGPQATIYHYQVKLLQDETVTITTEQGRIDAGDCVSIEQGQTTNIRKVAQVLCDTPQPGVLPEHRAEARECGDAKQELVDAQGNDAIDAAIRKVKILCDD